MTGAAAVHPALDVAAQANWQHAYHNLYVVELRSEIFEKERRFFEKNPHWLPGKLCVYGGMTRSARLNMATFSSGSWW